MDQLIAFGIFSILIVWVSWRSIFSLKNHGFYRFMAWEGILWLFVSNVFYWFINPFSWNQIIAWILLIAGGYLVLAGVITMKRKGQSSQSRTDDSLYAFEKTTKLIDTGIFRYIRHPLYSSLLFLCWGIFFKHPTWSLLLIGLVVSVMLFLTALHDEKECMVTFGDEYKSYMNRSKRFVPFLF